MHGLTEPELLLALAVTMAVDGAGVLWAFRRVRVSARWGIGYAGGFYLWATLEARRW